MKFRSQFWGDSVLTHAHISMMCTTFKDWHSSALPLFHSFKECRNIGGHHVTAMGCQDSLRVVIRFSDACRVCDCCRSVHCRRQAAEHRPELRQLQQGHQLRHDQLQEALGARARLWHVAPAGLRASTADMFSGTWTSGS